MFNKVATFAVAITLATSVYAEPREINKTVMCDNATDMLPLFKSEYGEEPMWVGIVADDAKVALVVNSETRTWSIVMFNDDAACLLESGEDFKYTMPKLPKGNV